MKVKTSELIDAALDWAVCEAQGIEYVERFCVDAAGHEHEATNPSTNWSQGGPIIEQEGIAIDCIRCAGKVDGWIATLPMFCEAKYEDPSPTPLIAAMRCFVTSRLGDEVDVPDELKGE